MEVNYSAEQQGNKLYGIGVLFFIDGSVWFVNQPTTFCGAEILIGGTLAAYGILLWRSASRNLSPANYIIVLSCAPVVLLCLSKLSEWVQFLNQQRGFSIGNDLRVGVVQFTILVCITVFGAWWADNTSLRERFRRSMRSRRFVK